MYDQIAANKRRTALLIVVFFALVLAIGYVFGRAFDIGYGGVLIAFVVAVAMTWGSYWYSDRIVLALSRARPVDRDTEPYLVNAIEGLSIAAGLPVPRAYVIDDPAPNAFATGRDPEHAAVAVTTGLMQKLDRLELEGVIAHELAHIKNRDTLIQTLAAVLAGTVVIASDWMLRSLWWRGGRRRDSEGAGQLQALFALVGIALAILAPIFATLIQMAISRQREYLADANGALLTRYPAGLASALRKIAQDPNKLSVANKATEPLYIYNPLKDYGGGLNALFNTHPPVEERIRRLEAM
ncbi:zinc metalloprotease HtpX [Coriobacteriia bacterium Es71-Z0120]|uniref:zinc metalloprotease HtpX n=1 Tax=Parvivirga hydrogeniphila TaxID=2939460 RepID=UPI002260F205|nr:zinc metalloprotease HtpX [Parvivirga hydrogeniphila]MCL4079222.1 zinc metalloprotease HtpX [Parvivirga hydrogeniphila]